MRGKLCRRQQGGNLDLFGQIAVTWPEVWQWLETVAGIPRDSPRARFYLAAWDVPGKIREAKKAGNWPPGTTSQ